MDDQMYVQVAAAFVRGRHAQGTSVRLTSHQTQPPLNQLPLDQVEEIVAAGRLAELRLHKFKRTMGLPRVQRVFGALRQIAPANLLDIGSGRGVFLWPLLDEFPGLAITAVDQDRQRASDLEAVRLGGIERLTAHQMDATRLAFDNDSFDVVTILEVLEHLVDPGKALAEVVRVARRFIILSVPSKPDDNPQHINLFSEADLRQFLTEAGVERVTFDYVPGHMIAVANVGE